jgi:hypothetical protein
LKALGNENGARNPFQTAGGLENVAGGFIDFVGGGGDLFAAMIAIYRRCRGDIGIAAILAGVRG